LIECGHLVRTIPLSIIYVSLLIRYSSTLHQACAPCLGYPDGGMGVSLRQNLHFGCQSTP
jgi:hypothetical protein